MEYIEKWLQTFDMVIAGIAGAFVALPFQRNIKGMVPGLTFIVSGGIIAHFTTTLVYEYLSLQAGTAGGVGFLMGAFGGSLIAAVTRSIQNTDFVALIKDKIGGRSEQ